MFALRPSAISFGAASAIVTNVGLIVGFATADIARPTVVAALLIVGLADNLTDSLSIHIYQESEKLNEQAAFRATLGNFTTRLFVSLSFVLLVLTLTGTNAIMASLGWGIVLLVGLTWFVAKSRNASVSTEIIKHLAVAGVVIAVSRAIGSIISTYVR